ncbi:hypothetical protein J6590_005389 [Homalodisca vitripennis]|nr:hypothetical protein J6590_005389 [Homalodisca vitripennis]
MAETYTRTRLDAGIITELRDTGRWIDRERVSRSLHTFHPDENNKCDVILIRRKLFPPGTDEGAGVSPLQRCSAPPDCKPATEGGAGASSMAWNSHNNGREPIHSTLLEGLYGPMTTVALIRQAGVLSDPGPCPAQSQLN